MKKTLYGTKNMKELSADNVVKDLISVMEFQFYPADNGEPMRALSKKMHF